MSSGQWMSGKASLHFDNIIYYRILQNEFGIVGSLMDRRERMFFREPLAERPIFRKK